LFAGSVSAREMENYPVVKLQSLDKVTARTMTFEANVGNTVKFGSLLHQDPGLRQGTAGRTA
jgi:hypothetical protein